MRHDDRRDPRLEEEPAEVAPELLAGRRVESGERLTTEPWEIARRYRISPHHLAKVLHTLAQAGVVESVRGDAEQRITILECEQRAAQGNASGEDLRAMGLYYQAEDPRKAIRHLEIGLALKDTNGQEFFAATVPFDDPLDLSDPVARHAEPGERDLER